MLYGDASFEVGEISGFDTGKSDELLREGKAQAFAFTCGIHHLMIVWMFALLWCDCRIFGVTGAYSSEDLGIPSMAYIGSITDITFQGVTGK